MTKPENAGKKALYSKEGKEPKIKTWSRILPLFLALTLVLTGLFSPHVLAGPEEETAESLKNLITYYDDVPVLMIGLAEDNQIIMGKGVDQPRAIASISKLMTYYVAMEAVRAGEISLKDTVTVSAKAAKLNAPGSSNYGLKEKMTMPLEKLLFGMMTVSGNDAACAIAEGVAGSESAFVERMNKAAADLGYGSMHFVNASGLTEENKSYNQSSARDLYSFILTLMKKYPELLDYAQPTLVDEPERDFKKETTLKEFMSGIPGLKGIKTGTSVEAGSCFAGLFQVKSAKMDQTYDIVTIVLGAPINDARWRTTKELVDIAQGSFAPHTVVDGSQPIERLDMPDSREGSVILYPEKSYHVFTYANANFDVSYTIDRTKKAPTAEEEVFGTIHISRDGKPLDEIPIVSHTPTQSAGLWTKFSRGVETFFTFLFGLVS